jgi:hypothetical protein
MKVYILYYKDGIIDEIFGVFEDPRDALQKLLDFSMGKTKGTGWAMMEKKVVQRSKNSMPCG